VNRIKFDDGNLRPEDLTDEQAYAISLAFIGQNWENWDEDDHLIFRMNEDSDPRMVLKIMGPGDLLHLEQNLITAKEHELADWMRRYRLERQGLN
jgi:hypothetical protein